MTISAPDLVVLYEHPEWQKPLFAALGRRRVRFDSFNVGSAAFSNLDPYAEVPQEAVDTGKRIVRAARLAVGGIEYLETDDGRRVFYDINANSNLRPSAAAASGFDPFERVVDFLVQQLVAA